MKSLVLFDFDGTLTHKDSFPEFIKFYKGWLSYYSGIIINSPYLFLYIIGIIPNWKAKERLLKYFFGGEELPYFAKISNSFSEIIIPKILRSNAMHKLEKHKKEGARIVLVSASLENWLAIWCQHTQIELIGSKLEVRDGYVTGRLDGLNCYGPEKLIRVRNCIDLSQYKEIYVYGDSRGDLELMSIATHPFYKYF